jgi:hypothetical protein
MKHFATLFVFWAVCILLLPFSPFLATYALLHDYWKNKV